MAADDWVKVIGAGCAGLAVVLGALGALWVQVAKTHQVVNSRMDQLLELTRTSSRAEGVLAGNAPPAPTSAEADPSGPT